MKTTLKCMLFACALSANPAGAAGVVPDTSVLIVDEEIGEGTMTVRNTDLAPVLLYTTIENIKEDTEDLVVATPPMARMEPGQSQLVRFLLTNKQPLTVQRLKRVAFEGIPFAREAGNTVQTTFRQDLPLIITPRSLDRRVDPWTLLTASAAAGRLRLCNDSAYVVRLAQQVRVDGSDAAIPLPKTYLLPGERFELEIPGKTAAGVTSVTLWPATVYGYAVGRYVLPMGSDCKPQATQK